VDSPYFTIYAECSANEAREWAVCFDEFRRYVSGVIHVPPTQLQPLTIVMFSNRGQLLPYLPKKNGHVPAELKGQTMTLPTGTVVISHIDWDEANTRETFYENGTYWFLGGFKYSGPDWFQAGLAGAFSTFLVTRSDVRVGLSPRADLAVLQSHSLMPLPQLFGIEMKNLDFEDDVRTNLFYAESWALVHYHIFGRDASHHSGTRAPQLGDFMEALQKGEAAEPAFRRIFGTDYEGMLARLRRYISGGNYSIIVNKLDQAASAKAFTAEVETDAGVEMAHGFASLGDANFTGARQHFLIAQTLPGGELRAEEALGDVAISSDDLAEAKVHYLRAAELGSRNYRVYYYLGELLERDALADSSRLPKFEPALAREAANRFERAINLYPRYVPSYEGLALLMPSVTAYSESDRQFLELGIQMAPDNDLIAAGLGRWEIGNHQVEKGQARLRGLLAAGRQPSRLAQMIIQESTDAQAASAGLATARQLMAEGKTEAAGSLVEKLLEQSSDSEQRAALAALQTEIGQLDLVMQAETQAEQQQWAAAATLAQNVLDLSPPAELAKRAKAVLSRVKEKK